MVLHGIQDFYSQKAILPRQVRETLLEANVRYLARASPSTIVFAVMQYLTTRSAIHAHNEEQYDMELF